MYALRFLLFLRHVHAFAGVREGMSVRHIATKNRYAIQIIHNRIISHPPNNLYKFFVRVQFLDLHASYFLWSLWFNFENTFGVFFMLCVRVGKCDVHK